MPNESRLFSFLDNKHGFTLHFLEGQKVIHDLVLIHELSPAAFTYHRATLLSALHMNHFLKSGESLGFYIDSEEPYYRFKIEIGSDGSFRTLLLPENLIELPLTVTGKARLSKVYPEKVPYTSITDLIESPAAQVVNSILKDSYQTKSEVIVSTSTDQSVMITKMPPLNVDKEIWTDISLNEYIVQIRSVIKELFDLATDDMELIVNKMEGNGFSYLQSKEVKFHCPCSKERFTDGIKGLGASIDEIFQDDEQLEVKCDYCTKKYYLKRTDF